MAALQSELADRAFHDPLTNLANRVLFIDRIERALLERDPERHAGERRLGRPRGLPADQHASMATRPATPCSSRSPGVCTSACAAPTLPLVSAATNSPCCFRGAPSSRGRGHRPARRGGARRAGRRRRRRPSPVRASVGLACASAEDASAAVLLRRATAAAQEAREAGSGTYRIHGGSHSAGPADPDLAAELESALNKGELVLHYQPIVELRTGKILGAEALVRWRHPVRGLIAPLHFLPIAVECGLIERVEEYVMRIACEQLRRWQIAYPATPELAMSINVAAGELSRGALVDRVKRCLANGRRRSRLSDPRGHRERRARGSPGSDHCL